MVKVIAVVVVVGFCGCWFLLLNTDAKFEGILISNSRRCGCGNVCFICLLVGVRLVEVLTPRCGCCCCCCGDGLECLSARVYCARKRLKFGIERHKFI